MTPEEKAREIMERAWNDEPEAHFSESFDFKRCEKYIAQALAQPTISDEEIFNGFQTSILPYKGPMLTASDCFKLGALWMRDRMRR